MLKMQIEKNSHLISNSRDIVYSLPEGLTSHMLSPPISSSSICCPRMRLSLHASVAHRRQSVFPVPVGDSKIALVPCMKKHKLIEAGSGLGKYEKWYRLHLCQ